MHQLIDFVTKQAVSPQGFIFTGNTTPWEVQIDLAQVKSQLNLAYFKASPPALGKYLPLMPINKPAEFISLQETATPLLKSKAVGPLLGIELYFKIEGKNPTGSFKDRGSAVDITVAKELGAQAIVLASTGNMAASCACYAAAAKIPCFVFVPEGVPITKLAQVIAFGGNIVQVKGTYNDAAQLAENVARELNFYLAGDYAYRVEGQKTAAFELAEQFYLQPPDSVLVPIGCGTNIAAYFKGFREYQQLGLIDRMPQIIGVQADSANAVVTSYLNQQQTITPLANTNTIASAIAVPNPIDGLKALEAIYQSQGQAVAVADTEILQAQYLLSTQEGLFVESAAAATVAGLLKLTANSRNFANKKVVCILTGDGLKDAPVVLKAAIKPPTIYPDTTEFLTLYKNKFFESKRLIFVDKKQTLFTHAPTTRQVQAQIKTLLNADYSDLYLTSITAHLTRILQKGKAITVADLQDSIQDVLEAPRHLAKQTFSVLNFQVASHKDLAAQATVTVKLGETLQQASAEGVGPVDAAIKALCRACQDQIAFKLIDYHVETRSQGIDAVVYVELKLAKGASYSLGHGASPDIIQASIEAFEEAYNGFC